MSDFFEAPPRPAVPEPRRYRQPPWIEAPSGTLPGVAALTCILAQTDKVAVCVTQFAAYPTGFEFDIVTMSNNDGHGLDPLMFHARHGMHGGAGGALPPELLRFGMQFSDGSKVTNMGGFSHDRQPPPEPIMNARGGGGGAGGWRQTNGSGHCRRPASSRWSAHGRPWISRSRAANWTRSSFSTPSRERRSSSPTSTFRRHLTTTTRAWPPIRVRLRTS